MSTAETILLWDQIPLPIEPHFGADQEVDGERKTLALIALGVPWGCGAAERGTGDSAGSALPTP